MISVPCEKCDEMMSAKAVVCPHCGVRQRDRDPIKRTPKDPYRGADTPKGETPKLKLSSEEARALLVTQGVGVQANQGPRGPVALLLPRAGVSPFARSLEWLLTLAGLPLLICGLLPFVLSFRFFRHVKNGSELMLSLAAIAVGSFVLWSMLHGAGWGEPIIYSIIGLSAGAIVTRLAVRLRVT